jgi:hypothetical protein
MNLFLKSTAAVLAASLITASFNATDAQTVVYPAYRIVNRIVYDQQPVTTYRLEHEIVYREQQVTTQKPVWETEMRVRRVTVQKPVFETSTRTERFTVRKAVLETETRTQRRIVRSPVTEQVMQSRNYVTYEPVTTMRTEYVDQGSYVNQLVQTPGIVRNRLRWLQGGYAQDPATGTLVYQRGGLHWVPVQSAGTVQVQQQYVPNVVERQVPQTTLQQKVVQEQVPVNVTRIVEQVVEEPYQVQVQKWVDEVHERPVQITTQRMETEVRDEPIQVRVCKWVTEIQTVRVPHTVAKWVEQTTTRLVPRTVTMRVPVDPCGGYTTTNYPSNVTYYSPLAPLASSTIVNRAPAVVSQPAEPAAPAAEASSEPGEPSDADETGQPGLPSGVVPNPLNNGDGGAAAGDDGINAEDGNSA